MEATKVLLVFPAFAQNSFWSMREICTIMGKSWSSPPLGLTTVAALLPRDWRLKLVDCNIEQLTDEDVLDADLVMTGGMIPQRKECLGIIDRVRALGRPVAVGGPDVTSSPDVFAAADFRILGEAEAVMDEFVQAWRSGVRRSVLRAEKFTVDVTRSPIPRFDLVKLDRYLTVGVQFSRGCPFTCEFCDIIELFGRTPRVKTIEQILAELDCLHALGHRGMVDFVDDNFIGNKKAIKALLGPLAEWQKKHGFPFELFTEASINLADDEELLRMMRAANFTIIFVGIETPDPATLAATRKKQNVKRSIPESIARINAAGIQVHAGFILGFDGDRDSIARDMIACIEAAAIPVCMIGLLTALPETQLSRRLLKEGRLDPATDLDFARMLGSTVTADQCTAGLNFRTQRDRATILADYKSVLDAVYDPKAYFRRAANVGRRFGSPATSMFNLHRTIRDLRGFFGIMRRLLWPNPKLLWLFLTIVLPSLIANPGGARPTVSLLIYYFDLGPFARFMSGVISAEIAQLAAAGATPSLPSKPADAA